MNPRIVELSRDALGLAGAGLTIYGVWLVYRPLGFIVAGVMMLVAAYRLARP